MLTTAPPAPWKIRTLGGMLILMAIFLCAGLVCMWPENSKDVGHLQYNAQATAVTIGETKAATSEVPGLTASADKSVSNTGAGKPWLSMERRILILVMIAGALGSFIHIAISFAEFVGDAEFSANWIWWYLLKPFTSMALAAIFYLVLRGGLMSPEGDGAAVNLYGVVAMSGMVGLFSKQATAKLAEVFDTLFRAKHKEEGQVATPAAEAEPQADAADLHATTSQANPNPDITTDEQLPPAKGGVEK